MAGILRRITPDHYNLYNENDEIVGTVHRITDPTGNPRTDAIQPERWYGTSWGLENIPYEQKRSTAIHPSKHHAARDLLNES